MLPFIKHSPLMLLVFYLHLSSHILCNLLVLVLQLGGQCCWVCVVKGQVECQLLNLNVNSTEKTATVQNWEKLAVWAACWLNICLFNAFLGTFSAKFCSSLVNFYIYNWNMEVLTGYKVKSLFLCEAYKVGFDCFLN